MITLRNCNSRTNSRCAMSELYNLLVDSHHGDYSYYLIPHAKPLISGGITPEASVDNMRTFVRGRYRTALRKATGDNLSDSIVPGYMKNLRGFGNQLYDAIPDALKDATRNMKKGDYLHIYAEELISIPW